MYFRLDQLGENVLRDFFVLVGAAETEVEVPAGDARRRLGRPLTETENTTLADRLDRFGEELRGRGSAR
jgi:hypothetical protein